MVELSDLKLVSQNLRVVAVEHWMDSDAPTDVSIGVICELPTELNALSSKR